MTRLDDHALLDVLGAALAPAAVSPDPDEVAAMRALVVGNRDDHVLVFAARPRAVRHPVRQALAVAAAIVALVVLGGVVALATGSSVPSELRSPARALGLPVDSSAVADTRTAMARLRVALGRPDDARVVAARDALVVALSGLAADDRATVDAEARALLARADARLRPTEIGDPAGVARPGGTGTTAPPATEQESPAVTGPKEVAPSVETEDSPPSTTDTTRSGEDDDVEQPDS